MFLIRPPVRVLQAECHVSGGNRATEIAPVRSRSIEREAQDASAMDGGSAARGPSTGWFASVLGSSAATAFRESALMGESSRLPGFPSEISGRRYP
jgi:hypothetical protein